MCNCCSYGGREKSLEAQAKAGLGKAKQEGQALLADGKQMGIDVKNKVTK